MAEASLLVDFLSAAQEPTEAAYRRICSKLLSYPESLANSCNRNDESLLLVLTDYSHRFTNLFRRLFSESNTQQRSFPVHRLGAAASTLLKWIIRNFHDFNVDSLTSVISPALKTCLTSGVREGQNLATVLINHQGIVDRLINDTGGLLAISSWVDSPVIYQQDADTLASWTDQLAEWIQNCPSAHSLREELSRWEDVKRLIRCLREDQSQYSQRTNATTRAIHPPSLKLSSESTNLLKSFALATPSSARKVSEIIESLGVVETIALLKKLIESFPCNFCRDTSRYGPKEAADPAVVARFHVIPMLRFGMEVFGHNVGRWEVLLSTPALSNFVTLRQSGASTTIAEKLFKLANGQGHMEGLAGSKLMRQSLKAPLFLNYCGLHRFIVWNIDIDVAYETKTLSQIIRVWDIVQASEIDKLLEHVAVVQSQWTMEKIGRCRLEATTHLKNAAVPAMFTADFCRGTEDSPKQIGLDVRSQNQYFFRLTSKFFPFTEAFFNPLESEHVSPDFPYKLSELEVDIVCYSDTSSIIVGRSGTGKTTCLVYKLIGRYLASKQLGDGIDLKQVFLTKSGELAERIRHDIRRILATVLPGSAMNLGGADVDGDEKPTFFSAPPALYPYVCTFEEFLQRSENTVALVEAADHHNAHPNRTMRNTQDHDHDQTRFGKKPVYCVDFPKFKESYWPHLDRNNDRKLPLSLVFAEIMGVVKGSAVSARTFRSLTYEEYLDRSSRVAPAFDSRADRSAIYQMFQAYENHKSERREVDYADRVIAISSSLHRTPDLKQLLAGAMDEIYVDEVQDQRSVDLELLLKLVKDSRYFHAAGDTAQAISQESTFRFQDLKAMIYDRFVGNADSRENGHERPRVVQLGLNYRSHHGIVKFGSMVMNLLWKTFPQTVDKLVPEEGLLLGPSPIMFIGCEYDVLTKVTLDGSEEAPADKAKFGAEQVVLVRDEESKARLKNSVGDIVLILTILQSKGMEFDDVVLFDFFTSCPEPDGWRSLHASSNNEARKFDSKKYAAMCTELKQLYVAVTRARTKLFVMETAQLDCLTPIVRLLTQCTSGSVVQVIQHEDASFRENLELLRADKSSDPKRWIERGYDLLGDEHLREALHCFEQAAYQRGTKLINAKILKAEGIACSARNDTKGTSEAYKASIDLFLDIGQTEDAVEICWRMGWLERAAGESLHANDATGRF
ncbi:MAG: hypothetical protein Q9168_004738 [Polycauliona sp. 1 TL-2023]